MKPRNDYVVIRRVTRGKTPSGIAVADWSIEGVDHVVQHVGPKVEHLKPGDTVLMIGAKGEDYAFLPNSKGLLIIKEANVVLVYGEDE